MLKPLSSFDAENIVANELSRSGWNILSRNFRIQGSELDIVANKGKTLAIIEVKARRLKPISLGEWESIFPRKKQEALVRGASAFQKIHQSSHIRTIRFDLALVWGKGPPYRIEYFVNVL